MATSYRIYPGIGIARIGNSTDEFFIGPEAPGIIPSAPYRDSAGALKRQAAQFRVYEFETDSFGNETCIREVTTSNGDNITWGVRLVNSKAAGGNFPPGGNSGTERNQGYNQAKLIMDSGLANIHGSNSIGDPLNSTIAFEKNGIVEGSAEVYLGELRTDISGRLLILGGHGVSASPMEKAMANFANNPGWYDDVSDGPVTATVSLADGSTFQAESAWVVVASPGFAPGINNVTTWFDQAKNIDAQYFNPILQTRTPSFTKDIYPILERTVMLQWVSRSAQRGHSEGKGDFLKPLEFNQLKDNSPDSLPARKHVFGRLVTPVDAMSPTPPSGPQNMPSLNAGLDPNNPSQNTPTALTSYQYDRMYKWSQGDFDADWNGIPQPLPFDQIPIADQPYALDEASLQACIGGPFFPGIESTYIMAQQTTYESPYRVDRSLEPGYMTKRLALPWQADYLACGALWWPAQRPVSVKTQSGNFEDYSRGINGYAGMVQYWAELGFITQNGTEYVETERGNIP